jgi:serine/threonine-protein kinase RsbT
MCLQVVRQDSRQGLRVTFSDKGPGIPEIELAMKDGYTTGAGMGMGLPGAKRLVNEFDLSSTPSEGTVVTIVRWKA